MKQRTKKNTTFFRKMAPFDTSPSMYYAVLHEVQKHLVIKAKAKEQADDKKLCYKVNATERLALLGREAFQTFFTNLYAYLFGPSLLKLRMFMRKLKIISSYSCPYVLLNHPVMCVRTDSPFQMYIGTISKLFVDIVGDYVLESVPFVAVHRGIDMLPFDLYTRDIMVSAMQTATWAAEEPLLRFLRGDKYDEYRLLVAGVMAGLIDKHFDFIQAVQETNFANNEALFLAAGLGCFLYKSKIVYCTKIKLPRVCRPYIDVIKELMTEMPF